MRFECKYGNIIRDTTDFLPYKADIFASQDKEDFCDGMESYDNQVFDDKESFLECYYELFDELRQKNLIHSARLHENGKCTHTWLDGM